MNILEVINNPLTRNRSPTKTVQPAIVQTGALVTGGRQTQAEKLSCVFSCMDIRSNDLACLPNYVINRYTKERKPEHPALFLLNIRPNAMMSPFDRRKLLAYSVDATGNAFDWIIRNPATGRPEELIPLTGDLVQRLVDKKRNIWYQITDPVTGETFTLPQEDVCDYKGPSHDGLTGESRLSFASEVIRSGLAAQTYNQAFYESGGQPSGVLTVDADLSGLEYNENNEPTGRTVKDVLRDEWEKIHSGAQNSHRIAILDHGLKYQSLSISQRDAMFIESQAQTVEDIARYFSMPLYKLQHGKQSYNSNEQNSIEYAGSLRPSVIRNEQEQTWKLLTPTEIAEGWEIGTNMMALLRSDSAARSAYYKTMWEVGAYSVNDILALEDLPAVPGGEARAANLNFVPLERWEELSVLRAGGKGGTK